MKWFAPVLVGFWKIWSCIKIIKYLLWWWLNTETHFSKVPFPSQNDVVLKVFRLQGSNRHSTDLKPPPRKSQQYPLFLSLNPQPICVGCHPQPSEPPADWDQGRLLQPAVWVGWLPSLLTCAAQKCGWIMEKCSQEGFFSPLPEQCVYGDAPVAYSTGKLSKEVPHRSQKHWCSIKI